MQPWLDVADAGAAVVVAAFHDGNREQAALRELGDVVWRTRHDLEVDLWQAEDAIRDAMAKPRGPCVLADTGDPPAGGAPGDSNYLLTAIVDAGVDRTVLVSLRDPAAARAMHAAGRGAELTLMLGGAFDRANFTPRPFTGRVEALSEGRMVYEGPLVRGQEADIGPAGVFAIRTIHVLVHEGPAFSHDAALYRSVGLRPEDAHIVVVKSPTQFRACYESMAHEIYEIETPGICTVKLQQLVFERVPLPMYPLDRDDSVERAFQLGSLPSAGPTEEE